jgi:hypothetical protein
MSRPIHIIKNVQTGEVTEREYTDAELAEWSETTDD